MFVMMQLIYLFLVGFIYLIDIFLLLLLRLYQALLQRERGVRQKEKLSIQSCDPFSCRLRALVNSIQYKISLKNKISYDPFFTRMKTQK